MAGKEQKKIIVGVCAMKKKANSKPMRSILTKLNEIYGDALDVLIFEEETICEKPVEDWPRCDSLISFHSKGFPLKKAIDYIKLRGVWPVNDLERQSDLLDRVRVYKILQRNGIEIPRYKVLWRDPGHQGEGNLEEFDDHIIVNGVTFNKPFVEKPVSAEDHNVRIYYPSTAGGGSQQLFRKTDNRSSIYSSVSSVRQEGSYIYEEFMQTDGTDVKVYAVGPDYAHAEARKSPALDGKVERDADGKEVRYPVILSSREKLIARKIVWAFKQTVCGFDLLRANGKSYVCDVNGFSFVKTSSKYYEDSARILGNMILRRLGSSFVTTFQLDDPPLVSTTYGTMMELRCVLAVIRHGDRTPKQKLKMEVRHKKFWELFRKHNGYQTGELKLKKPLQLQEVLDSARFLLAELNTGTPEKQAEIHENKAKLEQLKTVLEMYGHFSGINRKIQLRYQSNGKQKKSSDTEPESSRDPCLILIVKWGGELTDAGKMQASELGKAFRCLYPGGGQYGGDSRGLGFLRLHSTYRHDLKMYASEEGRVQMTAAAFAKGLLALDGELPPILVQMIKSANTDGLLDDDKDARQYQNAVKKFLHDYFQQDRELTQDDYVRLNPTDDKSIGNALSFIGNPRRMCERIFLLVDRFYVMIQKMRREDFQHRNKTLYCEETWDLAERRWGKLVKDFKHCKKGGEIVYDISKIPDIYDCIKYDLEHNFRIFNIEDMEELFICSKYMADVVVPQEYGITKQEKLLVGQGICTPLLKKLQWDLKRCIEGNPEDENLTRLDPRASEGIATPFRHVRTRLYFTSESHIHSLMNVLRFGSLVRENDKQWQRAENFLSSITEFNYMAQLVIMLYEDTSTETFSDQRFHVELHFSPGALPCIQTTHVPGLGYRPKSRENESTVATTSSTSCELVKRLENIEEVKSKEQPQQQTEQQNESQHNLDRFDADSSLKFSELKAKKMSAPVNIVSLGDKTSQPISVGACAVNVRDHSFLPVVTKYISIEELKNYSPLNSPRNQSPLCPAVERVPTIIKSNSDASCNFAVGGIENDDENYNANVVSVTEKTAIRRPPVRQRTTYAGFRHHTVNILRQRDSKFISTAVISGALSSAREEKNQDVPALMSTAVLGRGSSEPNLQTFATSANENSYDINALKDLEFFVPPLRSLETLHNQLSWKQVDEFLERITTLKTPIPSPPKTPKLQYLSRENSQISGSISGAPAPAENSETTVKDIAKRLQRFATSQD